MQAGTSITILSWHPAVNQAISTRERVDLGGHAGSRTHLQPLRFALNERQAGIKFRISESPATTEASGAKSHKKSAAGLAAVAQLEIAVGHAPAVIVSTHSA